MEPLKYRVFVCTAAKEEGQSSCVNRGSKETLAVLKEELIRRGLNFEMKAMMCGCFDRCERGPNVVVYPEGIWYEGLNAKAVPEFVDCQLVKGKPYIAKLCDEVELKDFFEKRKMRKMSLQRPQ